MLKILLPQHLDILPAHISRQHREQCMKSNRYPLHPFYPSCLIQQLLWLPLSNNLQHLQPSLLDPMKQEEIHEPRHRVTY